MNSQRSSVTSGERLRRRRIGVVSLIASLCRAPAGRGFLHRFESVLSVEDRSSNEAEVRRWWDFPSEPQDAVSRWPLPGCGRPPPVAVLNPPHYLRLVFGWRIAAYCHLRQCRQPASACGTVLLPVEDTPSNGRQGLNQPGYKRSGLPQSSFNMRWARFLPCTAKRLRRSPATLQPLPAGADTPCGLPGRPAARWTSWPRWLPNRAAPLAGGVEARVIQDAAQSPSEGMPGGFGDLCVVPWRLLPYALLLRSHGRAQFYGQTISRPNGFRRGR